MLPSLQIPNENTSSRPSGGLQHGGPPGADPGGHAVGRGPPVPGGERP